MASEQPITNQAIAKAVAEVTMEAIQDMSAAMAERPPSMAGPKVDRPAMKQPNFNWEADDKYTKLKTLMLDANNIISSYNTPSAEHLAVVKH